MTDALLRCGWEMRTEAEREYHDTRWCVPLHDDRELFAMLCLEGMQAGLSWALILKREAGIRAAFDQFDPVRVAAYDQAKKDALYLDPRIIRNRRKIDAVVQNAQAFLAVQQRFGSFDAYIWQFSSGVPEVHHPAALSDVPTRSPLSERVSADLIARGFRFVGPVIVYSYLQAIGVCNDHLETCAFKYARKDVL